MKFEDRGSQMKHVKLDIPYSLKCHFKCALKTSAIIINCFINVDTLNIS